MKETSDTFSQRDFGKSDRTVESTSTDIRRFRTAPKATGETCTHAFQDLVQTIRDHKGASGFSRCCDDVC